MRDAARQVAICALLVACVACVAASAGDAAQNIVLIVLDDLDTASADSMPQTMLHLRDGGIAFTDFYVAVSNCCPSRASILRGQYAHNHRVLTENPPDGGFQKFRSTGRDTSTIATWLHDAGYRTVLIGKYLNGYAEPDSDYVPPGWDEWYATFGSHYFLYRLDENGSVVQYGFGPGEYETDVFSGKLTDFIRRTAGTAPFFAYVAPYAPHSPAIAAPRHARRFLSAVAPRPPSFNEADVSDKPEFIRTLALLDSAGEAQIDSTYRARLRTLLAVDDLVDSLFAVLTETGQIDSTWVFVTSDNGFHLGEHRMPPNKGTGYAEDVRVPLLVRGPGVPAGETREHVASNIDLAPTFAGIGHATAPVFVDGTSLLDVLGPAPPPLADWRAAVLVEYWVDSIATSEDSSQVSPPAYGGVRTNEYAYTKLETGEIEFYDLVADPYELENIATSADSTLLARFAAALDTLHTCDGGDCFRVAVGEPPPNDAGARVALQPVGRSALVRFTTPRAGHVRLILLDVAGRVRRTLVDADMPGGEHNVPLARHDLPRGVYLLSLHAPSGRATQRVVLLR